MTTKMMIWRRVFLIGVLPGEPILRLMTVPYSRGAPAGAPREHGTVMSLSMGSPGSTPIKKTLRHMLIFVAIAAQQFFNYVVLWFAFALALIYLIVARGQSIAGYLVGIILIGLLLW